MTDASRPSGAEIEWSEWMGTLGRQARGLREFLGWSQDMLALHSGVSQGAVSRFEAGRGTATPLLVVMRVELALARGLRDFHPSTLGTDARRLRSLESWVVSSVGDEPARPNDETAAELLRILRGVRPDQRSLFLAFARASSTALATVAADEPDACPPRLLGVGA